jgi:alkylation response protein AidB-like acyl-CoA dehydrogenase
VDFDFSEEQYALRDLARDLFEKESPPSRLRDLYAGGARDASCWRAMAGAGLTGLTVPEEFGGSAGNELDLALVLEEAGRTALPEPIIETVAIAAPLLAEAGTDEQKAEWLPRIASGEAVATVLLRDQRYAVEAGDAHVLIAETGGAFEALPRDKYEAWLIQTEDRARRLYNVDVSGIAKTTRMSADDAVAARAHQRAAVAAAGFLNGIAMRLVEMTTAYVKSRQQFGRPVGSFQAVKHRLADTHTVVEQARAATWYAAYALANNLDDAPVAAGAAKAVASDAEAFANAAALQLHGGIGFTWEHDLHLWLKRGKALEHAYGSASAHRRAIAGHLFREGAPDA